MTTTLHFFIFINAPVEKVWKVMLEDKTFREWSGAFFPGSYFEGSWEQGADIRFLAPEDDGTLSGMLSRIKENREHEFVSIEHYGVMLHGVEDTSSDNVMQWAGMQENYTFTAKDGGTEVRVDLDVTEEDREQMERDWPKALNKLKEIAEK